MRATIVRTCFVAVFMAASQASAAPIPIQDLYDPADVLFDQVVGGTGACTGTNPGHDATGDISSAATCNSLSFQHSLLPEFDPVLHDLLSASLTLYFRDDETMVQGVAEEYVLSLEGSTVATQTISSGISSSYSYDVQAQMNPDGLLQVLISRTGPGTSSDNDFWFEKSIVNAEYDREADVVPSAPEPASLLLFGVGLVGAGRQIRKRRQRQQG
jgi:hypothetical protein